MRLTPFPVGEMPANVKPWEDGPPFGRIELDLDLEPRDGQVVTDRNSGYRFEINLGKPCGLGCKCAAEATWIKETP